tara:strand:+ start:1025 stop:2104 length:1080 start_codon:yes stop_codon:yes gene_type:complete
VTEFYLGSSLIGANQPTYFVADIAANHDGDIKRALKLIELTADSGANAAKFQNFKAATIVSDYGFKSLGEINSHQSNWGKSVYETYDQASISMEWTHSLKQKCDECGIDYFTAPYDLEIIDQLDKYVCAWKVGSGDISWIELIERLSKGSTKPLLIATGASSMSDVRSAMLTASSYTKEIVLMQCNTNYTGSIENLKYVNLNVIKAYQDEFSDAILGLSDHTPGHATVLGAVSLGARVIEKHFTDDTSRVGPDHKFSMDPKSWQEMVLRTRELESALGDGNKKVEQNEKETYVLQRRALRATENISVGTLLSKENITPLRPCPPEGLPPSKYSDLIGRVLIRDIQKGDLIKIEDSVDLA